MKNLVFLVLSAFLLDAVAQTTPPTRAPAASPTSRPYGNREDVNGFIRQMAERHGFVEQELKFLFARARR